MNPDRYTPQQARELGLINDKEYAQRQTAVQAVEPVYPELYLSGAPAVARSIGSAVTKNVLGKTGQAVNIGTKTPTSLSGVSSNTPGSLRVGTAGSPPVANPTASTAVTNVANTQKSGGQLVAQPGSNVANTQQGGNQLVTKPGSNVTTKPELQTIDGPLQIGGPKALNGPKGKNDPNVIDVQARVVPDKKQIGMNQTHDPGDGYPNGGYYPYRSWADDNASKFKIDPKTAAGVLGGAAIVGGGAYGLQKGLEPRQANTDNQTAPNAQTAPTMGTTTKNPKQAPLTQPDQDTTKNLNRSLTPADQNLRPTMKNDPRIIGSKTAVDTTPVNKSAQSTTNTTPATSDPTFSQSNEKNKSIIAKNTTTPISDPATSTTSMNAGNLATKQGKDELDDIKSLSGAASSKSNTTEPVAAADKGTGSVSVTPLTVPPDNTSQPNTSAGQMRDIIKSIEPVPKIDKLDVDKDIQSNIGSDIHNQANASDDPIGTMNDLNFGKTPPTPIPTDTSNLADPNANAFVQDDEGEWQKNIAKESLQLANTINTPRYSFLRGL
jgi:hypothetical protein